MPPLTAARPRRRVGRPVVAGLAEARREQILAAATRAFAERGFHDTDLEVVAADVGVSKGTLYRYFPSKRELFLGAVDRGMTRLREKLDACVDADRHPIVQIEDAIRAYFEHFASEPDLVELLVQERASFKDRDRPTYFVHRDAAILPWQGFVRALVEAGEFRPVSPEGISELVSNLLYGTLFTNYFAPGEVDVEQQIADIKSVLLFGVLGDAARAAWSS